MDMKPFIERMMELAPESRKANRIFDDVTRYEEAEVVRLARIQDAYGRENDAEKRARLLEEYIALRDSIRVKADAPERVCLWPEDKQPPTITVYESNADGRYNNDPDFRPYFLEMLLPADVEPKGAVVCIPGGDQGFCTLYEAYQVCKEFNARGYQAFILHNRVNHNPWTEQESGVDTARCLRILRRDAAKYRIDPRKIAVAGFSNGGLTGDNCIRYFSGEQKVEDHFPGYVPDELDAFYGAPDAFLCVYGPRFVGSEYDFTGVVYPPTFFAVGREDTALQNLNYVYPILVEHGVKVEVHTFAGVPHGVAGQSILHGKSPYPLFDLWYDLADAFMQDAYR